MRSLRSTFVPLALGLLFAFTPASGPALAEQMSARLAGREIADHEEGGVDLDVHPERQEVTDGAPRGG